MKKLFYRLSGRESFAKLFSIEQKRIMFYRKLLLPLLFAGLTSLLAQGALAQVPPWELGGFDYGWGGPWGSNITCTQAGDVTNVIDNTSFTQTATVQCHLSDVPMPPPPAICKFSITYSGLVRQCEPNNGDITLTLSNQNNGANTSTLTLEALCGQPGLMVNGTLNCNPNNLKGSKLPPICEGNDPCIAKLGLTGSESPDVCTSVFLPTDDLAVKQVLQATLESTGKSCEGFVADAGKISTRFCTSGTFNSKFSPICIDGKQAIAGTTTPGLEVEMEVSPESINVKCDPNKDNGKVRFTIFGSDSLAVTLIDIASLDLEGVGVTEGLACDPPRFVDKDNFLDLQCQVPSCPDLGPALEFKRGSSRTVNIELTGSLLPGNLSDGLLIHGKETVKTSPPPK
jgi:hypothetical protein